jgi:HEAT repeat protein
MRNPDRGRVNSWLQSVLLLMLASSCGRAIAQAQTLPADPVDELRQVLKSSVRDPAVRDRKLNEIIPLIQDLNDLRRAIVLREWRDQDPEQKWIAVDLPHRATLARWFAQRAREVFQHGDETAQLAVLCLLTDFANVSHASSANLGIAREFTPDLVSLIKRTKGAVRMSAVRVLAQIDPEPESAASAFTDMLAAADISERAGAAEALANWMHSVSDLAAHNSNTARAETARGHLGRVGQVVVPMAGRALGDTDPRVRGQALRALGQSAEALKQVVLAGRLPEDLEDVSETHERLDQERDDLLPLILALKDQGAALTRVLTDPDSEVVALARQALEDMTNPQLRLLERANQVTQDKGGPPASLPPTRFVLTSSSRDPLLQGLQGMVRTLAAGLADKDVRARRTVIDVLEGLGPAAAPAAAQLVQALADSDPFVRWAAARTLGKISPVEAATAVPALARLLEDTDLDLRLAAAVALERYGPAANAAVTALMESVQSTEPVLRIASIRALGSIGAPDACQAIPILSESMTDPDSRVRQMAAKVLGKMGPLAREAEIALRQALDDKDPEVQKAAGEALLLIKRPDHK